MRTDLLTQVIQPGRFSSPEPNLTFHIRERALNGELIGLVMHDTRDKNQAQSYLAERGVIVKQDPTAYLVMTTGHIIRRTDAKEPPQIVAFDKYAVDLDKFEAQSGEEAELKPRERYFGELINPDPNSRLFKSQPGMFRAELHERFASLLYPFAFAFIIVAFVGQARSTRSSRMESLIVAFLIAAFCRLGGLALNNFVTGNAAMVPAMYLLPVSAMALSYAVIKGADHQRSGLAFVDRLVDELAPMASKLGSLFKRKRPDKRPDKAGS
jgi:lipopolysaccharide export system permease protein